MEALTDEMEALKKRHGNELLKANVSTSDSIVSAEKRVAEVEQQSHCVQNENKVIYVNYMIFLGI